MKKIYKYLVLSPILLGCASGLSSCSNKKTSERFTLKIINSEDYIYLNEGDPNEPADMVDQFIEYIKKEVNNGHLDAKFANVDVVYDTSDTNETLYSELQTGKSDYDLINVSDYMAQKMAAESLIVPLYDSIEEREHLIPNYHKYGSSELVSRLDSIKTTVIGKKNTEGEPLEVTLDKYAVGYMWGTLGILFNPEYSEYSKLEKDDVLNDMHYSYSALWNPTYRGTISIKNSMRDTFAAGLMAAYEDDFITLKAELDAALEAAGTDEEAIEAAYADYLKKYSEVFNGAKDAEGNDVSFKSVVNNVHKSLTSLKKNIFGLEVDSGKQDIVTGKIGINLAWSGDAVYAMDQAEDEELVGENTSELYYCVPELGSNLWFDTWVMPKNDNRSEERRQLALLFLDFMSDPANAMQNMEYTGYTSFIGGDAVLELIRDWYDARTDEVYLEDYPIYAVSGDEFFALDYSDCLSYDSAEDRGHRDEKDSFLLYGYNVEEDEDPDEEDGPKTASAIVEQNHLVMLEDSEVQKTYGDLLIADMSEDLDEVDLSYFFNDTLDEYENDYDTFFYSEEYYAEPFADDPEHPGEFYHYAKDDVNKEHPIYHANKSIGRQFFTQYPDKETINRCAVMRDFGANNKLVMNMWEEFKSDPLPTPAIVVFVIIIASAVGLIGFIVTGKVLTNRIRKKRKAAQDK